MTNKLDAQVELAENFLRAGNIQRAEEICRDVLQKDHHNLGAYEGLFSVHVAKRDYQAAYELCDWRLGRQPECPDTYVNKLVALAHLDADNWDYEFMRILKGKKFMAATRPRLANYPLHLAQAEVLYRVYFLDSQEAIKRIEYERQKGRLSPEWLDRLEASLTGYTGDTSRSRELLVRHLAENPQDFEALNELSITDYHRGRLFSAIKYARQAKRAAPEQAAMGQEVIIFSIIGLIPLFWLGQLMMSLTVLLSSRAADYVSASARYAGLILTVLAYGGICSKIMEQGFGNNNLLITVLIVIGIWVYYVLFSFQEISRSMTGKTKSIELNNKY